MSLIEVLAIILTVAVGLLSVAMAGLLGYQFYTALQMKRTIQKECEQQIEPLHREMSMLKTEVDELALYIDLSIQHYKQVQHWEDGEYDLALLNSFSLLGEMIPYWHTPRFRQIRDNSINTLTILAQSKRHLPSPIEESIRMSARGLRTALLSIRSENSDEMHKLLEVLYLHSSDQDASSQDA